MTGPGTRPCRQCGVKITRKQGRQFCPECAEARKKSQMSYEDCYAKGGKRSTDRSQEMARLFRQGSTYQEIGDAYGVSRQRVQQILRSSEGFDRRNGGQHRKATRQRLLNEELREKRCQEKWGCDRETYEAAGDKARRVFGQQRNNAGHRGIGWELTFGQWWRIWKASGKWAERGRGHGYCMCRHGDVGPYALGNVYIATGAENAFIANKRNALPIGVRRTPSGRFIACKQVDGVKYRIGIFDTPEQAHAAYLAFDPSALQEAAE